jgi:hypothetical protein
MTGRLVARFCNKPVYLPADLRDPFSKIRSKFRTKGTFFVRLIPVQLRFLHRLCISGTGGRHAFRMSCTFMRTETRERTKFWGGGQYTSPAKADGRV